QYTAQDLEALSRSELQGLCKKLNLRAVGKTSELLSRVLESHDQARGEKASDTNPPTTNQEKATPTPTAAAAGAAAPSTDFFLEDVRPV
ncbi:unnamed protein product, partial [Ectocarpus sp. 8 AP-2014]